MKILSSSLETPHFPVMLNEIIRLTSPSKGGFFVDCTFGGGGYSKAILKFPNTKVVGLDRDKAVISFAEKLEREFENRFQFYKLKFSKLDTVLKGNVDTIIFDLGLSSIQLNNLKRGFSFNSKEKLDMSMGLSNYSAQEAINNLSESHLKLIIKILGEEKEASKIAKNIAKVRLKKKITRVDELVDIIKKSKKKNYTKRINPSTKTFQALRIFVNKEITELINGIVNATKILKPGGKILIVSFHSIEDKIVKYFFSNYSKNRSRASRYIPDIDNQNFTLFEKYDRKVIRPSNNEILKNNRSRSAKLRFAIRSKDKFFLPTAFFKKFEKYLNIEATNV